MLNERKRNLIGQLLLLLATLAWGSSFVILKETIESVPGFFVIGIRFLISGLAVGLIFIKKLIKINKTALWQGVCLGLVVAAAYLLQTWGLKHTTPARNAFLTSTYCIMCPFLVWLFFKRAPKAYNLVSAGLCLLGIGLVAFSGGQGATGDNLFLGDALTLCGAVFFSLQILFIDRFQEKRCDPIILLVVQFFVVGVIMTVASFVFELPAQGIGAYKMNSDQLLRVGYLTLACTIFAQGAQIFGQRLTSSSGQSAIILSLEAVFGVFFSVLIGYEKLTVMLVVGFVVIFGAILISELRFDFAKLFKKKTALNESGGTEAGCEATEKLPERDKE